MPVRIAPVVDSIDALPESVRGAYEERDGRFHLAKEIDIETPDAVAGLRSALDKEKRSRREASEKLTRLSRFEPLADDDDLAEVTADEIREAVTLRRKGGKAPDAAEVEKIRATLVAAHKKEVDALTGKLTAREQRIQTLYKQTAADAAIAEKKGNARALRPHVLNALRVVEDGDEVVVQVVDDSGKERYSKATGLPMTVSELVAEMAESDDFKPLFPGSGMGGSGTTAGDRGGARGGKVRITEAQYKDPATYRRLREEAAKAGKALLDYVEVVG